MDRRDLRVRITRLEDQGREDDLRDTTPEERVGMMWQLALDAWAFKGEPVVEPALPRHIVHVYRSATSGRTEHRADAAWLEQPQE